MARIQTIKIVEDNTAPSQLFTLKRDGTIIDLTGATVSLILYKGSTLKNSGHQTCTVTTPTSGIAQYDPLSGDFDTPGTYKADVKIVYADLSEEILYDQLKFKVRRKLQ